MYCTIRGSGQHANNNSTFEDGAIGFTEIRGLEDQGLGSETGSAESRLGDYKTQKGRRPSQVHREPRGCDLGDPADGDLENGA